MAFVSSTVRMLPRFWMLANRKDAAKILDVGFPTLWRWNNEGLLHAIKVGGRKVYYRYDDVLNLMKGGKLC